MTVRIVTGGLEGGGAVPDGVLVEDSLEGVPVTGYGTSIMAGWLGASYPGSYIPKSAKYLERLARRLGTATSRTASAIPTEGALNAGRVGNTTSYMAKQMMDTNYGSDIAWKSTDTGLVVIDAAANDAASIFTTDSDAYRVACFERIMRTLLFYVQLGERFPDTDSSVAYTGTWAARTGSAGRGFNGSTMHQTTTLNSYAEITCTGPSVDIFIGGMDPAPDFASPLTGGNVEVKVDGVTNQTVDTTALCKATDADTGYGQHCVSLRGIGSGAHTIRLTNKTSGGNLIVGCWGYPSADPVAAVLVKVNDRGDSAGLNAVWPAHMVAFDAAVDTLAGEFDRVISVDPKDAPYTVATHTIDDLHLNSVGHAHYADLLEDAVRAEWGDAFANGVQYV